MGILIRKEKERCALKAYLLVNNVSILKKNVFLQFKL